MQEDAAEEMEVEDEETEGTEATGSNVQVPQEVDEAVPGNLRNELAKYWTPKARERRSNPREAA